MKLTSSQFNMFFDHIGIAVNCIKISAQFYIDIGYTMGDIVYDPLQDVYIAFLEKKSMPRIELLEPGSEISPICKTLEKSGVSPYHICYQVKNIEITIVELKKRKFILLSKPVKAIAMTNRLICFLYNQDTGLIELVEN
jgi:methylmalonyl-CoA/ethylmalonyl-CoA epimerase